MSIILPRMKDFPAMALADPPCRSQGKMLKLLTALVYVFPEVAEKTRFVLLSEFSADQAHRLMCGLMDEGWVRRYERPDHNKYYFFPDISRIARTLGIEPESELGRAVAAEKKQYAENVKKDLADLVQRKLDRKAAALEAKAAKQAAKEEKEARLRADYQECIQEFISKVISVVDSAAEVESGAGPVRIADEAEYYPCGAGVIIAQQEEDGSIAIRIVEKKL